MGKETKTVMVASTDKCPECGNASFYTRKITQDRVCKICGRIWPLRGKQ